MMLKVSLEALQMIETGVKPVYRVTVWWQEPETYTEDDHLLGIGDLSTSMSEGSYEIANTTVQLKNTDYYFSRKLARELPNNKLAEIHMEIAGEEVLVFRGVVPKERGWALSETVLTLNLNA